MVFSLKKLRWRIKTRVFYYLRCGAKTATFLFWASLYMLVLKMTLFRSSAAVKGPPMAPDNYTKWLLQGPVLGDDEPEVDATYPGWLEPDNATIAELERRATRVQSVCRERALTSQPLNSKEFFVDHAHNLVWCNIFKAASSSWMYNFNLLGGYDKRFLSRTRHVPLMLARKKFPRPSEEELRDAVTTPGVISLLVVREPFTRLLSAYRDKLESLIPPYYRKLARQIVTKHREKSKIIFGPIRNHGPTFYEFVTYLIEKYNEHRKAGEPITFDEHWAPYFQFCSPCAVNFSVIAKVETLYRDSAYVIQQLGLGQVLGRKVKDRKMRLRKVMNKSRDGRNTTALLRYYYSQLDEKMLDQLLQIYGTDFEMFGYDPTLYKRYVRKDK